MIYVNGLNAALSNNTQFLQSFNVRLFKLAEHLYEILLYLCLCLVSHEVWKIKHFLKIES